MKKLLLFFFAFVVVRTATAQIDMEPTLKEARTLRDAYKENEAFEKFKQVLIFDEKNYEALCNASFLASKIGKREKEKSKQTPYYLVAKSYAVKALAINPNDAESNFAMALAMGRMAQISETKEKIAAVRDIKKYVDIAIRLNSKHYQAWHLLGMWNFEVANLNVFERKIADMFFGGLPEASKDKAVDCVQKAISLNYNYILYHYDMATIYKDKGEIVKAKEELNKAISLKPVTPDDPGTLEKAKVMLKEL